MMGITEFFGRRYLKRQLAEKFREIVFRNAFGELGCNIEAAVQEEKDHYVICHDLTREEVNAVWDHLGPVRIE